MVRLAIARPQGQTVAYGSKLRRAQACVRVDACAVVVVFVLAVVIVAMMLIVLLNAVVEKHDVCVRNAPNMFNVDLVVKRSCVCVV